MNKKAYGFTIVELLIVIVVIGILAAISIVAYNGIQSRARDTQRKQDVQTISKALELYYIDNGQYPTSVCGSSCPTPKKINGSWLTTSDGSWDFLESQLAPKYISELPADPMASTSGNPAIYSSGFNYDYITYDSSCGIAGRQTFRIYYKLEVAERDYQLHGDCPSGNTTFGDSYGDNVSIYATVKN